MIKSRIDASECSVIIVGGNSGIGVQLSNVLLNAGAKICSIDIQSESAFQDKNMFYFSANPTDEHSLNTITVLLKNHSQQYDGLVNLSGTIASFDKISSLNNKQWNETFDISFKSCLNSCKLFSPLLGEGSSIVNMSSGLAFIGRENYGPYAAAKAAIVSLTQTLAAELGPKIRVNSIAPGAVDTDFIRGENNVSRFDIKRYKEFVFLKRMAQPKEIADVIAYLLSDAASHVNAQCIHINGGI